MLKAFKYRLYPNVKQQEMFEKHFGCCRYIYNWGLELKTKEYKENNNSLSCYELINKLKDLKKEFEWLSEINSQSLQQSLKHLDNAYTKFFREKKGFPNFHSKHGKQSFSVPQFFSVDFEKGKLNIPKIKDIKIVFSRVFKGQAKNITISKTRTNKYFASILVELPTAVPKKYKLDKNKAVGIDLGLKHFIITSQGDKIDNPKYAQKLQNKISYLQSKVKHYTLGGQNRKKYNQKIAKLYERVGNQRTDFLQKLSSKLISENQTICLEDLNVQGMVRNHKLARSIQDASWSSFVNMLEYKAEWYGNNIIKIGRFDPSSKMCSVCGKINNELVLNDRDWECDFCKTVHDRDMNAAINIKDFAFQKQNLIGVPKENTKCFREDIQGRNDPVMPTEISGSKQSQRRRNPHRSSVG